MSAQFVSAEIHVVSDGEVSKLGAYRFLALPKIGETITLGEGPADVWLKVTDVIHMPVPSKPAPDGVGGWEGLIVLNCEIDT